MKVLGYAAIIGGAAGMYSRYSTNNSGQPSSVPDPAGYIGMGATTAKLLDTGFIVDVALVVLGFYLLKKG